MSQHRWMKFWPQDFESDPALKMCSLAAQGLWIRMICRMHEGVPYGHLTIGERAITPDKLAVLIGLPLDELKKLLNELRENAVFSETDGGVVYSRRMVRDGEHAENGRVFANRRWDQDRVRNSSPSDSPIRGGNGEGNAIPISPPDTECHRPPNTLESEADSDSYAPQNNAPDKTLTDDRKRGSRLPDAWQPSQADWDYAEGLGLDVRRVAEDFRGYWLAKTGGGATKAGEKGWSLTWQGWCRRESERRGTRGLTNMLADDPRRNMGSLL